MHGLIEVDSALCRRHFLTFSSLQIPWDQPIDLPKSAVFVRAGFANATPPAGGAKF